jgi:hypothetical protein
VSVRGRNNTRTRRRSRSIHSAATGPAPGVTGGRRPDANRVLERCSSARAAPPATPAGGRWLLATTPTARSRCSISPASRQAVPAPAPPARRRPARVRLHQRRRAGTGAGWQERLDYRQHQERLGYRLLTYDTRCARKDRVLTFRDGNVRWRPGPGRYCGSPGCVPRARSWRSARTTCRSPTPTRHRCCAPLVSRLVRTRWPSCISGPRDGRRAVSRGPLPTRA